MIDKIRELLTLPVGWDGYESPPVSLRNMAFALAILDFLQLSRPQMVPGSGGSLQLEWHLKTVSIEIYIATPNRASVSMHNINNNKRKDFEYENSGKHSLNRSQCRPLTLRGDALAEQYRCVD